MSDIDKFYFDKEEPNKSCLLTLRDIILNYNENITETKKYGMPCFCYKKKPFCYLWIDKKTDDPYILMVKGKYLNHSELEDGSRSKMKILRVNAIEDIPINTIQLIFSEAIKLY